MFKQSKTKMNGVVGMGAHTCNPSPHEAVGDLT